MISHQVEAWLIKTSRKLQTTRSSSIICRSPKWRLTLRLLQLLLRISYTVNLIMVYRLVVENKTSQIITKILSKAQRNMAQSGRSIHYSNVRQYLNKILWIILLGLGKPKLWFRNNKDLMMPKNYYKAYRNQIHILCQLKYLCFKEIDFCWIQWVILKVLLIFIMKLLELIHLILMYT